ncbi:hypothetical protein N2152v2_002500 [Parachlorella kessleri]
MGAGLDAHQYSDTTESNEHQAMLAPTTLPAPQELFNVEEALLATPTAPPRAVMPEVYKGQGRGEEGAGCKGGSIPPPVVWHKSNCKWEARIYEAGRQKFLGYYLDEDEAAMAYDDYAVKLHGSAAKLNFPHRWEPVLGPLQPAQPRALPAGGGGGGGGTPRGTPKAAARRPSQVPARSPLAAQQHPWGDSAAMGTGVGAAPWQTAAVAAEGGEAAVAAPAGEQQALREGPRAPPGPKGSSRFRGVSWSANCSKWRAQVWKGNEVHHLGYYEREEDAAHAYDEAVVRLRGPGVVTNFSRGAAAEARRRQQSPAAALSAAPASAATRVVADDAGNRPVGTRFKGVSWCPQRRAWLSQVWDGASYRLLGAFDSEVKAARAYDGACLSLEGPGAQTNFPHSHYEVELAALALSALSKDSQGAAVAAAAAAAAAEQWGNTVEEEGSAPEAADLTPAATPTHRHLAELPQPLSSPWAALAASPALPAAPASPAVPPLFVGSGRSTPKAEQGTPRSLTLSPAGGRRSRTASPTQGEEEGGSGWATPTGGLTPTGTASQRHLSGLELHNSKHRGTSPYNGVSWDKRKHKWFSQIQQHGKRHFLGYFDDEVEAARAYDRAALRLYGASAQLNFPTTTTASQQGPQDEEQLPSGFPSATPPLLAGMPPALSPSPPPSDLSTYAPPSTAPSGQEQQVESAAAAAQHSMVLPTRPLALRPVRVGSGLAPAPAPTIGAGAGWPPLTPSTEAAIAAAAAAAGGPVPSSPVPGPALRLTHLFGGKTDQADHGSAPLPLCGSGLLGPLGTLSGGSLLGYPSAAAAPRTPCALQAFPLMEQSISLLGGGSQQLPNWAQALAAGNGTGSEQGQEVGLFPAGLAALLNGSANAAHIAFTPAAGDASVPSPFAQAPAAEGAAAASDSAALQQALQAYLSGGQQQPAATGVARQQPLMAAIALAQELLQSNRKRSGDFIAEDGEGHGWEAKRLRLAVE